MRKLKNRLLLLSGMEEIINLFSEDKNYGNYYVQHVMGKWTLQGPLFEGRNMENCLARMFCYTLS